jgi:hypothetical protein
VLNDDGIYIHLIPTACKMRSLATHYIWLIGRVMRKMISLVCRGSSKDTPRTPGTAHAWWWTIFPPRHGERGNTLAEVCFYSDNFCMRKFIENNFTVLRICFTPCQILWG